MGFGGLDKMVIYAKAMMDGATVVTPFDRVNLCIGLKHFDKCERQ